MPENYPIIEVNKSIKSVLERYLKNVSIIFDLPELNVPHSDPVVSVFLYDIHEDLQLRSAESRVFKAASKTLLPGWINIKCNYLITYWGANEFKSDPYSPESQPGNQAIQVMSQVLNALINNRKLPDISGSYAQIVPPKESLNSLGHFWQSLGNRPRLSLNYSVTIPVHLTDGLDNVPAVSNISTTLEQIAPISHERIIIELRKILITELQKSSVANNESQENISLAVSKINFSVVNEVMVPEKPTEIDLSLSVSGITYHKYLDEIEMIFNNWEKENSVITIIDNYGIRIKMIKKKLSLERDQL
ncbi:hypothetical protein Xsto_01019 [Xenorhabdus stockiae]|uniref:Pvc16 N-terminal domain-containing protein n=1 Tax=Xenorhabdus stockiae TaxID=351614 RepID=A0A2D0KTD1_9GAMM|nr:DUF4255 domain-containing protein [Xenorhabdus stockiae]PHM66690.1 hypothetical protein Xsto_01019 [Xenorhabdus stockiae]